ncbi:MAG: hypothetical protein IKC65_02665 [Lentisphaeria bacterium]|nr:hypothetical protein [Lentisphaeria bacterium]
MTARKHENGVALLFALGLLSLMAILGTAFVTNSLMTQKTAANLGARAQAQVYFDSAVNRILISMMAALAQDGGPADFANIYSTDNDGKGRFENVQLNKADQLTDEATSKMNAFVPKQPEHKGSKMKAAWSYIRDNTGKIVARMAYQVLPASVSSISLDRVLLGIYNHNSDDTANFGKPDENGTRAVATSWNTRIGRDISEFNLGFASGADAPFRMEWKYSTAGAYAGAQFPENIYTGSGYSQESPFCAVPSFEDFFAGVMYKNVIKGTTDEIDTKQQLWFKRWFTDSKEAVPEVFYRGEDGKELAPTAYHRFNVGKLDTAGADMWYRRLKSFPKAGTEDDKKLYRNSKNALDDLLQRDAQKYLVDVFPDRGGLPYLRMIGADARSFDNLEDRRRQIAANLNDYCDSDSIPTSDEDPKRWGTIGYVPPGNTKILLVPKYTGNEKTPYINELALGFKVRPTVAQCTWPQTAKDAFAAVNTTVTVKQEHFEPQLLAELIRIYKEVEVGTNTNFKAWLNNISFKLDAGFSCEVTYHFIDTEKTPGTFTFDSAAGAATEVSDSYVFKPKDGDLAFESSCNVDADFSKGYRVHKVDFKSHVNINTFHVPGKLLTLNVGKAINSVLSSNLDAAGVKLDDISGISFKLTKLELHVKDIQFDLRAAGLFNDNGGMDFVNITYGDITVPDAGILPMEFEAGALKIPASPFDWNVIYVTGMEARDPRQNLNFKKAADIYNFKNAKTDWVCKPKVQNRLNLASMPIADTFGTFTIVDNGGTVTMEGLVNSCSNPSAPFSSTDRFSADGDGKGVPGEDYDQEKVSDPAWPVSGKGMSTAYIRNAPMTSLWELGAIHRATAWETINLKHGLNKEGKRVRGNDNYFPGNLTSPGVPYGSGDGLLLDQVKLTDRVRSHGQLDVNMLLTSTGGWDNHIFKALYHNIILGHEIGDLYTTPVAMPASTYRTLKANDVTETVINKMKTEPAGHPANKPDPKSYTSRVDFIAGPDDPSGTSAAFPANGFGMDTDWDNKPDAQQEELIGKTANLLTAGKNTPSTVHAVVIVQTIKGVSADSDNKVTVVRPAFKKDGTALAPVPQKEKDKNEFDLQSFADSDGKTNYVYFDEITSELRALVTIKVVEDKDNAKRLQLYNIQYY